MKKAIFFLTKIDFFLISEALIDLLYKTEAKKPTKCSWKPVFYSLNAKTKHFCSPPLLPIFLTK